MNRNEKLLEAIGQIDDKLILDAEKAGAAKKAAVASGKKKTGKKVTYIRYRNALAACAVLAICLGIYGLLAMEGMILSPFKEADSAEGTQIATETTMDMASVTTADEAAPTEEKAVAEEAAVEEVPAEAADGTAEAAAVDSSDTAAAGETVVSDANSSIGSDSDSKKQSDSRQGDGNTVSTSENVAATETAEAEKENTEKSESAVKETEDTGETENGDAVTESIGQMELAAAQEPMVMTLGLEDEEISGNEVQQIQDLPVPKLEAKLLKTTGANVTLSLSNQYTDATVTYASMYELEQQTLDGWNTVAPKDNVAWVDILIELEPGKSSTETVRLANMFGELEAGHYRLVKNCTVTAADSAEERIVIYTEFDIAK